MRKIPLVTITVMFILALLLVPVVMKDKVLAPEIRLVKEKVYAPVVVEYYVREEVNKRIQEYIKENRYQEVVVAYAKKMKSYDTAHLLITIALKYEVPVNVVFAMARQESGFNEKALGAHGEIGLMQLLPRSFPKWAKKSLYDPRTNISLGCEHLLYKKAKGRGTLEEAIMRYNGKSDAGFDHMTKVLKWEREFDKAFNEAVWEIEYKGRRNEFKSTVR
jgi:soluble lytic murein transglycosylase-like protein